MRFRSSNLIPPQILAPLLLALIALFQLTTAGESVAQLPTTQLKAVHPSGGNPGSTVETTISGDHLDNIERLVFSHPGITASKLPLETDPANVHGETERGRHNISIAADVPVGFYEVRAVGRYGVSNPRAFVVDEREQVVVSDGKAASNHHSPESAIAVEVGSVISGRVTARHTDYYRFNASQGDPITIDCSGIRIDSRIDATLVLYDSAGVELQRVRDTRSYDPVIALTIPEDGDYLVAVYDFLYRGGDEFQYRLAIDGRPHVEAVFPPAGQLGSAAEYTLYGYHLPGGEPVPGATAGQPTLQRATTQIALPAHHEPHTTRRGDVYIASPATMLDTFQYAVDSAHGKSQPISIGVAAAPILLERESNDSAATAQAIAIPCELVGQFQTVGDEDWVTFRPQASERIWIEVISNRAGSSTDPTILVQEITRGEDGSEQVKQLSAMDDVNVYANRVPTFEIRSRDPAFEVIAKQGATYRVMVRDIYNKTRGDPRMTYRMLIGQGEPDFRLVTHCEPYRTNNSGDVRMSSLVLRQGGRVAVNVHVFRRYGFAGDIEITAEGLPAGVTCHEAIASGGAKTARLVFSVEEGASFAAAPIRIVGRSLVDGKSVVREARSAALQFTTENTEQLPPTSRLVQQTWLSVIDSESENATIDHTGETFIETSLGGRLALPFRVTRRNGYKSALRVVPEGLPRQLRLDQLQTPGDEGKYDLKLKLNNFPSGTFTFYLLGRGRHRYEPYVQRLADAKAKVKESRQLRSALENTIGALVVDTNDTSEESSTSEAEQQELQNQLQEAQQQTQEAIARLKQVQQKYPSEDANFAVVSDPIRLRVHATPINVEIANTNFSVPAGRQIEIPIRIERRFGFSGPVSMTLQSTPGLSADPLVIKKDQNTGSLVVRVSDSATSGEIVSQIVADLQFGGLLLANRQPLKLTVEPTPDSETSIAEN